MAVWVEEGVHGNSELGCNIVPTEVFRFLDATENHSKFFCKSRLIGLC